MPGYVSDSKPLVAQLTAGKMWVIARLKSVVLSHYHVVSYVGLVAVLAAAVAVCKRPRWLAQGVRGVTPVVVMLFCVGNLYSSGLGYSIWQFVYGRQDRVVRAVELGLGGSSPGNSAVVQSRDELRNLTASDHLGITHPVSVIERRPFNWKQRTQISWPPDLGDERLRRVYGAVASVDIDGLLPPSRRGVILVAAPQLDLRTRGFFAVSADSVSERSSALGTAQEQGHTVEAKQGLAAVPPGNESELAPFGWLEIENGLNRYGDGWEVRPGAVTRAQVYSSRPGRMTVVVRMRTDGPTVQPLTVTCGSQRHELRVGPEMEDLPAEFDVGAGTTLFELRFDTAENATGATGAKSVRWERLSISVSS